MLETTTGSQRRPPRKAQGMGLVRAAPRRRLSPGKNTEQQRGGTPRPTATTGPHAAHLRPIPQPWGLQPPPELPCSPLQPQWRGDRALATQQQDQAPIALRPGGDAGEEPHVRGARCEPRPQKTRVLFSDFACSPAKPKMLHVPPAVLHICHASPSLQFLLGLGLSTIPLLPPFPKSSPESICFTSAFSL